MILPHPAAARLSRQPTRQPYHKPFVQSDMAATRSATRFRASAADPAPRRQETSPAKNTHLDGQTNWVYSQDHQIRNSHHLLHGIAGAVENDGR